MLGSLPREARQEDAAGEAVVPDDKNLHPVGLRQPPRGVQILRPDPSRVGQPLALSLAIAGREYMGALLDA